MKIKLFVFFTVLISTLGFGLNTKYHAYKNPFYHYIDTTSVTYFYRWENIKSRTHHELSHYTTKSWEWLKTNATDIYKVNRLVNSIPYAYDFDQFGVEEYWQTPLEFLLNGKGDCEDYAILKYYLLRELGYKDEDLRIVGLLVGSGRDNGHAVLLVRKNDKWFLLDNRYSRILMVDDIPEKYIPLIGMNHSKYYTYYR